MDNKQQTMNDTINFVNETYDKLTYFELYGNSVMIFIFITFFVFVVFSYCKIMQTKENIADDWVNQRCKPQNMLFAGLISKPEGTTAFQYTNDNFQYCVQNILTNISGYALEPFQYMMSSLTNVFSEFVSSIQQSRELMDKLRSNISIFTEDIFARILNVMIPIQKMFIALMDTFQKIQGVMTSGLYTMLGTYYTLQALMGAMLDLMIKLLMALAIIIVGLWIMPFTWPAAASMTAVFLGISVPLSIIIYFMTEVLHIKTSAVPKLRCFDECTKCVLKNGTIKFIKDIQSNDVLIDGSIVTSKIKVLSKDLMMYELNGIIVSGCHIVSYNTHWIPVYKHPEAIKLNYYDEPYLYCLNTTNKIIRLNAMEFADWDEVYGNKLEFLFKQTNIQNETQFAEMFNEGFEHNVSIKTKNGIKNISDIMVGEELLDGAIVYGIVELTNYLGKNKLCNSLENKLCNSLENKLFNSTENKLFNLLVSNGIFETENNDIHYDYNWKIDTHLENIKHKNII
jgi:hypothetical protein